MHLASGFSPQKKNEIITTTNKLIMKVGVVPSYNHTPTNPLCLSHFQELGRPLHTGQTPDAPTSPRGERERERVVSLPFSGEEEKPGEVEQGCILVLVGRALHVPEGGVSLGVDAIHAHGRSPVPQDQQPG